jgi:hypothetical protein
MYNNILLNKYPYFFKYLYKDAKKKYNKYCEENEMTCHQKFKMSFKQLQDKNRLTTEEQEFIDNFYKYCPLTVSNSPMNLLCKYIEGINFEISKKIKDEYDCETISELYKNKQHPYTDNIYNNVIQVLKEHISGIKFDKLLPEDENDDLKYDDDEVKEYKVDNDILEQKLNEVCSDVYTVINCLVDYFYTIKPSANKNILWGTYGKYIFNNVKDNTLVLPKFPFPSNKGDIKYLNKTYELKEIKI